MATTTSPGVSHERSGPARLAYPKRSDSREAPSVDLLRVPVLGRFLRWRWSRSILQAPLFALAVLLVLHGLYGPDLAPKNLATLVTWVHYRGLLVLALLVAGNFFCMACPFMLVRDLARCVFHPVWNWPRRLRNKWLAVGLFVAILFCYELFGWWGDPGWTAALIIGYFVAALVVDSLFKHAAFCKWVCPIGQFNFLASTMSPLEVRVRDSGVCEGCRTKDCIRGRVAEAPAFRPGDSKAGSSFPILTQPVLTQPVLTQRGCELALFQPLKVGNLDCTFCLDCVYACPHDNVGLITRLPGSELWSETPRSGVGEPHLRKDMAALILVFTFGALLNAFGMVSPVYAVQAWLGRTLGTTQRGPILGILFAGALIVEPVVLLSLAAWAAQRMGRLRQGLVNLATRYAITLIPIGFGVWLAHYAFHFFTGLLTVVPVAQNALADVGWPALGEPNWTLSGLPVSAVHVLELGFLSLGLVGSWIVAVRMARRDLPIDPWRVYLPWMILHALLWASAVWLLAQPMEMRGTFLGA